MKEKMINCHLKCSRFKDTRSMYCVYLVLFDKIRAML